MHYLINTQLIIQLDCEFNYAYFQKKSNLMLIKQLVKDFEI